MDKITHILYMMLISKFTPIDWQVGQVCFDNNV